MGLCQPRCQNRERIFPVRSSRHANADLVRHPHRYHTTGDADVSGLGPDASLPVACLPPAFNYDGKTAETDDSYSTTVAAGSQAKTSKYTAESKLITAADGKLQIRLDCKTYKDFPAREYSVELTNLSKTEPTGIVSDFRSLGLSIDTPESAKAVTLNVLRGSTCKATDFIPKSFQIETGKEQILSTASGRSSNDYVPFIELNLDEEETVSVRRRLDGNVEGEVRQYGQGGRC